jgi:hypothetical protein
MLKTHRPHHRARPRHHVGHFLNLLPIAQRVRHRRPLRDAADAAPHKGDWLIDPQKQNAKFGFLVIRTRRVFRGAIGFSNRPVNPISAGHKAH